VLTPRNVKDRLDSIGYVETARVNVSKPIGSHYSTCYDEGRILDYEKYLDEKSLQKYSKGRREENYLEDLEEELKHPGRYFLEYADGGRCVTLSRKLGKKPEGLGKHKGDVQEGYSRSSRNGNLKFLLSINYDLMGLPLFYTTTYPNEWSDDPRQWKRDLKALFKRIDYKFENTSGTWRLEPQKRGAPHFSGFLWGCDWLRTKAGKKWFSEQWYEVVNSGDEKHLRAGTRIDHIENYFDEGLFQAIFYLAKYQTKAEKGSIKQEFDYPVGRYWGAFNRKNIAIHKEKMEVNRELFFKVRRVMKKLLEGKLPMNKFREVVKGKQSGLWAMMKDEEILKLMNLVITNMEGET